VEEDDSHNDRWGDDEKLGVAIHVESVAWKRTSAAENDCIDETTFANLACFCVLLPFFFHDFRHGFTGAAEPTPVSAAQMLQDFFDLLSCA
jgi:hypothetical protein